MTNTLVIDTSFGSTVGVLGQEAIVETDSHTHVEKLQVNIARAVDAAGLNPMDLDRIVVGVGPAPFTGLRVGIVAAKAIAYATGAQLLGQDILEPQTWMMKLKRQGDSRLKNCDFLNGDGQSTNTEVAHHLTLAVNDARRRELYFALYADTQRCLNGRNIGHEPEEETLEPFVSTVVGMDIDYPQHIVERINQAVNKLDGNSASTNGTFRIDVVGHGALKYVDAWLGFGHMLGNVIDHSVLDTGAAGLEIFSECAMLSNGINSNDPRKAGIGSKINNEGVIKPVEPLYLRRPDVSVPNPLKHVLNHAGATKA
ncbi:tRNA (adenosine(37)-N6)-threonylcarbamoyltransferase complex dimerization subunit type 1 TsaB [Bifidobacterium sp. ESL0745]|uniref:tRNA (adenosine(37)-N6)-threonylcarbamoyltransferase complex dimerization subunit type 1 TsaB n=1 Tax=Bifidobacterium sp. ESL0745 TaxID=2983226 RepID=UPI0023F836B6|nr:tRNA (adenosine(37)-N6)-threonylcarbamoyltransferase complex dimerization subunit type 1 TsaB [Bifidobacterium sp. ESL0745]MDF7665005.1 tRNA (adenosine(37)-N6)-threonylcarbamoyltransferase complex dimerization subunit type 1 TsaB [Bifidobacterium sp. ESL0745]